MLLRESAINEDFIKYGSMEMNNKTKDIYIYIGDIVDSTNSRDGNIVSLYCKDGMLHIRDKNEFKEKFTTIDSSTKINTIFENTQFTMDEIHHLSENSVRQIYEKVIKCIKVDNIVKHKIKETKIYTLEMLFYNAVCEVFGKNIFNDEIDCFSNPRMFDYAVTLVCGYFNWTFYKREDK